MITGPVLAVWIAAGFLAAVGLGWLLRGVWAWACMATSPEHGRVRALIEELHRAEEAREAAEAARAAAEARAAALEDELGELRAGHDGRLAELEADRARALAEAEHEARTAWDGLAAARRRIAELESRTIERGPAQ